MLLRQMFDAASSTYTYLVADPSTRRAALVDPVLEQIDRDLAALTRLDLELAYVLETHVHADHVTAAGELRRRTGASTVAGAGGAPCMDKHVTHGEMMMLGSLVITALATPGHTNDGTSYRVPGHVLTGDTLLIGGCGRADFQNGDAGELFDSITRVLFRLPDDTIVLPGHDYRGLTASTIGEEKKHNARVAGRSREEFVALMADLGLPRPKRMDDAVPANLACGQAAR